MRTVVAAAALAAAAGCGSAAAPGQPGLSNAGRPESVVAGSDTAASSLAVGSSAWVSVSVARLWQSPNAPRRVDAPALRAPVRFRVWVRAMTFRQRFSLDLRSDTEALMGDRVVVVRLRPHWAKVVVPSQPTQKDPRGYPGWVPRRQLTAVAPSDTGEVATVTARTAWLRTDDDAARRLTEISFGTDLPVLGSVPGYVRVAVPGGAVRRLTDSDVAVHATGQPAVAATRASLTVTAKSFVGLPYLWGGLSGFGLDCSGLTWLDHRVHGLTIPRDALPQSRAGRQVTSRMPGDLLFYATGARVHHVSMYLGDGQVIHAPRTGQKVRVVAFSAPPLHPEYVGARRYLD
jgi:cell wall-associated NlpC family hydrolase